MADKREETPDILGNVLDEDPNSADEQTATADESVQQGREEAEDSKQEGGADKSADVDETPKRKATYYLHEDTLSNLEELWFQLRQQADEGEKRKVSKSAIVEAAIEMAADEYNAEGKGSKLARRLLE